MHKSKTFEGEAGSFLLHEIQILAKDDVVGGRHRWDRSTGEKLPKGTLYRTPVEGNKSRLVFVLRVGRFPSEKALTAAGHCLWAHWYWLKVAKTCRFFYAGPRSLCVIGSLLDYSIETLQRVDMKTYCAPLSSMHELM
jgi:hypothetical protein